MVMSQRGRFFMCGGSIAFFSIQAIRTGRRTGEERWSTKGTKEHEGRKMAEARQSPGIHVRLSQGLRLLSAACYLPLFLAFCSSFLASALLAKMRKADSNSVWAAIHILLSRYCWPLAM